MTIRVFGDVSYPVPGVDTAIEHLRPGVEKYELYNQIFVRWEDSQGRPAPTWDEVQEEIARETNVYMYYEYERNREKDYPDWRDQLDLLYHDIKNGNLENGSWIAAVESVKEKYPKPEEVE